MPVTFMLTAPADLKVYVATQPVDFRKGADGLALWKDTLGYDPMKGVAVGFRAERADRVKIVALRCIESGSRAVASSGPLLLAE